MLLTGGLEFPETLLACHRLGAIAPAAQAPLRPGDLALLRYHVGHGQTELSGATTLLKGPDATRKTGSVGRPIAMSSCGSSTTR
jgi:hypothetical protein